jgi:hypothetical protein
MSYRESRAPWRKLWRKEPSVRRAKLSYRARSLSAFLLAYADDAGCLGLASKTGHRASGLARMIGIESTQRRAFYREADELLDHGDDGEPLALIIRDGHLYLTRFGECQANRTKADTPDRNSTGSEPRPNQDPTKRATVTFRQPHGIVQHRNRLSDRSKK